MKILHIAPFNTAGVPMTFVQAERALGHESHLITLGRNKLSFKEDICLDLPFLNFWGTTLIKKIFTPYKRRIVDNIARIPDKIPIQWSPGNLGEQILIRFRESVWNNKIHKAILKYNLHDFDIYQLDGGLGFYRDSRFIIQLKKNKKKIICCYTGSDLRTRGVIPEIDHISYLNITVEFDLLQYHPNIYHVPFPLNISKFKKKEKKNHEKILIGHAPTNRAAKGSNEIISIIKNLRKKYPIELILIEKMPYSEAIKLKSNCDIFIDQIGDLGYGINSLESLAMGIATCTCLAPGFTNIYPEHPFIEVQEDTLESKLIQLINDPALIEEKSHEGRKWVTKIHNARTVVQKIHRLAEIQ
jgi:hypothetical protein